MNETYQCVIIRVIIALNGDNSSGKTTHFSIAVSSADIQGVCGGANSIISFKTSSIIVLTDKLLTSRRMSEKVNSSKRSGLNVGPLDRYVDISK